MLKNLNRQGNFLLQGLLADKKSQFRWAFTTVLVGTIPSALCTMLLLARLSAQARAMGGSGETVANVTAFIASYCHDGAMALSAIFAGVGGLTFLVSVRNSSQLIGPVARLERQVDCLIEGKPGGQTVLRKDDYMKRLADRINTLSNSLSSPVEEPGQLPSSLKETQGTPGLPNDTESEPSLNLTTSDPAEKMSA